MSISSSPDNQHADTQTKAFKACAHHDADMPIMCVIIYYKSIFIKINDIYDWNMTPFIHMCIVKKYRRISKYILSKYKEIFYRKSVSRVILSTRGRADGITAYREPLLPGMLLYGKCSSKSIWATASANMSIRRIVRHKCHILSIMAIILRHLGHVYLATIVIAWLTFLWCTHLNKSKHHNCYTQYVTRAILALKEYWLLISTLQAHHRFIVYSFLAHRQAFPPVAFDASSSSLKPKYKYNIISRVEH